MSRIPNLSLSETEVTQEIDFKETFGIDISTNAPMKAAIGQRMIDIILERTAKSEDAFGQSFHKYSKSYEESLMFKAFKQSKNVNLELTGDMLSSLDIISDKGNKIKIGIKDSAQAAKAYGHMTGMKGHPVLDGKAPIRMFFGLTEKDLADLKKEFSPDIISGSGANSELDSILLRLTKKATEVIGGLDGSQN